MATPNKLSEKDVLKLYDFLCLYESKLKAEAGLFDIENKELVRLLQNNNIKLGGLNKKDQKRCQQSKGFILYDQRQNIKPSGKDKVHHLLRHIRNAIAHGLIVKSHNQEMTIIDKNASGNLTMKGSIIASDFYMLLNTLIKSKIK